MKSNHSASCMLALLLASPWAVAQTLSADLFARHSEITDIALSPDGSRVALAVPAAEGTETHLQVVPLDGTGEVKAMRFGKQKHVTDIYWTTDNRLVVSKAEMEPLEARPYSLGEIIATNADGSDQELLFGFVPDAGMAAFAKDACRLLAESRALRSRRQRALRTGFRPSRTGEVVPDRPGRRHA